MSNKPQEDTYSEDINLSEYDRIWKKMRDEINANAKQFVPLMYDALRKEGYTPQEAREKIKKDSINIWKKETIDKWIPTEAKQEIKVLAGKKGGTTKSEIEKRIVLDSQSSRIEEMDKDIPVITRPPMQDTDPLIGSPPEEEMQPPSPEQKIRDLQMLLDDKDKRIMQLVKDELEKDETINKLLRQRETQPPSTKEQSNEYNVTVYFAGKDITLKIIATDLSKIIPPNKYVTVVIN